MSGDLYGVLKALPIKHQRYLITHYAERLVTKPKLRTNDDRLRMLATVLGTDGVVPYRHAYLHRASRFTTLYERNSKKITSKTIEDTIKERYDDWSAGEQPDVDEESPPTFNRMERLPDGSLSLDFVSRASERLIQSGYSFIRTSPIHHDYVTVHADATLEISSRTSEQRDQILKSFTQAVGLKASDFAIRAFDRPGQWKALQAALGAQIFGHQGNRRGKKEPAAYSMHAPRGEKLDDLPKWTALAMKHEDARELGFFFDLAFNVDGYPEYVFYYLNTHSGQIKFPEDLSEYARNRVLNEYLAIARQP